MPSYASRVQELDRRPGVSFEDLLAAVRVHADRVHDAVRRLGCDDRAAVEVVETSALDLVEAVAARPETVPDAVGWWFARARALAARVASPSPDLPLGGGVLAADEDQLVLAEALEQLPEPARLALLLRDAYALPDTVVAAALGTGTQEALHMVGQARIDVVPLLDDEPAPPAPSHAEDLAVLARLGEGGPVAARDATARRHALSCAGCRTVTDTQQRVHLLLRGLAVVALAAPDRSGVLARVEARARQSLPDAAALVLSEQYRHSRENDDDPRLLSPLLAALGVVIAVVLGTGAGVLLSRGTDAVLPESSARPAVPLPPVATPTPIQPAEVAPPPPPEPAPSTSVFVLPPRTASPSPAPTSAPPTPTTSPDPAGSPAPGPSLTLDPPTGAAVGQALAVRGSGWPAAARIAVEYVDSTGRRGARRTVTAGADGSFDTEVVSQGAPGAAEVRASDGSTARAAAYQAQA